ncbi:MAG: ubiquinone anaerobic biosynthesis accessory factor UbiT [Wenzhouxiangella sp.]
MLDFSARHLPPAHIVGLPLRLCPERLRDKLFARSLDRHLQTLVTTQDWQALEGKLLAIEITDMDLRLVLQCQDSRLVHPGTNRDAVTTIRGRAGDFLALAARQEDPDTLFFERRLEVCGDTATGLLLRNLLDRMPADALPLPTRIVLNRLARFSARLKNVRPGV